MQLSFRTIGSGHPLIILHGLYGSSDNWLTIARSLSGMCRVILVDQRNHGNSPHSDILNYQVLAEDLKDLLDQLELPSASILGHSMGGKAAIWFATRYPGRVSRLIVADIGPRSYLEDEGPSNHSDEHHQILDALEAADATSASSIGEVDARLEPLLPGKRLRQFLLKNLVKGDDGHYRWRINLPAIRANLPYLAGDLGLDFLRGKSFSQFPVLFIKGEKSPYIREPDIALIGQLFPNFRLVTIKNAGHWLHAEYPEIFGEVVRKFLIQ